MAAALSITGAQTIRRFMVLSAASGCRCRHGGGVAALEVCDWQGLERRPVGGDGLGGGRGRAAATPWSLVAVLQLGELLCGGWWGAHSLGGSCCRRC